jgi:hypothetical protein
MWRDHITEIVITTVLFLFVSAIGFVAGVRERKGTFHADFGHKGALPRGEVWVGQRVRAWVSRASLSRCSMVASVRRSVSDHAARMPS